MPAIARRPGHHAARSTFRPFLSAVSLAVCGLALQMALPSPTMAQVEATAPSQHYEVPAGALAPALRALASSANVLLTFTADQTDGKSTPGLKGSYTVQAAFNALLASSGLQAVPLDKGGYVLRPAPAAAVPIRDTPLPVVTVNATVGPAVIGRASDGYRSTDNRIGGLGPQRLVNTPFSVSVLPTELLVNQRIEDIGLLDRIEASVTSSAASPGTYSQTYIRGLPLNSYSNYRYNGLTFLNFQLVGLENKERVEVLSGLSALQAGFSSPGGLLNYVTKRPGLLPINDLTVSVDGWGDAKLAADLSRTTEDGRFGLRVNAATERLRSFVKGADGERALLALAADWRLTPSTLLQVDLEHERRRQAFQALLFQNLGGGLPANVNPRTFIGQDWAEIETEYTMLSGKLEHSLNSNWTLTLEGNWARQSREQNTIILDALQPDGEADVYNFFAPAQRYVPSTVRASARGHFSTGPVVHDIAFGYAFMRTTTSWADYAFDYIGSTNVFAPRPLSNPRYPTGPIKLVGTIHEQGLFFNDVLSFGEAWKAHVGGRYATRKQTAYDNGVVDGTPYDKDVFTPSVAVVFKPAPSVSTYLSYIEGLENGGTPPLGTTNPPNQPLPPLTSQQKEAGIKAEFGQVLAQAALFQIDRAGEYTNASKRYVQDGRQRHRGLQLSLSGKLAPEWTVFGSALLMDAKFENTGDASKLGKRPMGVPERRLALVGEYAPRALDGWVFSGNWTSTGSRELNDSNTGTPAAGYDLFGAGARYNLRLDGGTSITFRLNIDNLFDKFYWASANGAVVAGAPRTVSAGATFRF